VSVDTKGFFILPIILSDYWHKLNFLALMRANGIAKCGSLWQIISGNITEKSKNSRNLALMQRIFDS
jgi:hypothetical protein